MKFFNSLTLLLLSLSGLAQVDIFISNSVQKFNLAIDGFQQHEHPLSNLVVKDLDTNIHQLHFQFPNQEELGFKRDFKMSSKGIYKYIITQNFEGKSQLRYRGQLTQLPKDVKMVTFSTMHPVSSKVNDSTNSLLAIKNEALQVVNPPKAGGDSLTSNSLANTFNSDSSSVFNAVTDSVSNITSKEGDAFAKLILELENAQYEFNRLSSVQNYLMNHSIKTSELKRTLMLLKYDNTRLQLLNFAVEHIQDPENMKILSSVFEYELSKQQFRDTYLK